MKNLSYVKEELERIFSKGVVFNKGLCSCFEYAELLIDCDTKESILAIYDDEEMTSENLVGLIDFNNMINIINCEISVKASRFYDDEKMHAWLNFNKVCFRNNAISIKCDLYISY